MEKLFRHITFLKFAKRNVGIHENPLKWRPAAGHLLNYSCVKEGSMLRD